MTISAQRSATPTALEARLRLRMKILSESETEKAERSNVRGALALAEVAREPVGGEPGDLIQLGVGNEHQLALAGQPAQRAIVDPPQAEAGARHDEQGSGAHVLE